MRPRLPGTAVIAASSVFFATMAVLARTLAGAVPAPQQVTVRHLVGLGAMALYFAARRRTPQLRRPGLLFLRGFFGGGAVLLYFVAIERLGAAPATVLSYVSPVWAAVWAAVFLGERPTRRLLVGLALATGGAALVTAATGDFSRLTASTWGALAGVGSGVFGGAAMATVKAVREDADAGTVFLAFCVVGLGMSAPLAAPGWVALAGPTLLAAVAVGALALSGQLLFTWGMGHTTATAGSATTQLVPALAWLFTALFLEEPLEPLAAAGALLCIGGVLLGLIRPRPGAAAAAPAGPPGV